MVNAVLREDLAKGEEVELEAEMEEGEIVAEIDGIDSDEAAKKREDAEAGGGDCEVFPEAMAIAVAVAGDVIMCGVAGSGCDALRAMEGDMEVEEEGDMYCDPGILFKELMDLLTIASMPLLRMRPVVPEELMLLLVLLLVVLLLLVLVLLLLLLGLV